MLSRTLRSAVGQCFRGESSEEATPTRANLGLKNEFYFNEDLKQWVERGQEHLVKPSQPLPPPPTKNRTVEKSIESPERTEPSSSLGDLMRPPQHSLTRPAFRSNSDVIGILTPLPALPTKKSTESTEPSSYLRDLMRPPQHPAFRSNAVSRTDGANVIGAVMENTSPTKDFAVEKIIESTESTEPSSYSDDLMRRPEHYLTRSNAGSRTAGANVSGIVNENRSPPQRSEESCALSGEASVMVLLSHTCDEACKDSTVPERSGDPLELLAKVQSVDNLKVPLADLCKEIAASRHRAMAARHARALYASRQDAWEACSRRGSAQSVGTSLSHGEQEFLPALANLSSYQDLEQEFLLAQIRVLWAATFQTVAASQVLSQGGLHVIVTVLRVSSDPQVQIAGCGVLHNIAEDEVTRASIVDAGAITPIIDAMRKHQENLELLQIGLQTLFALALSPDLKGAVLAAGAAAEAEQIATQLSASLSSGQSGRSTEEIARCASWGCKLREILDYRVL